MVFNMTYGTHSSGLEPLIVVTAPTGSTVTCDGVVGTEVQGTWTFPVAIGTHTIVATQGTKSKTETVNVDKVGLFSISISYSRLPEGYTEVASLGANGSQYIDTLIKANQVKGIDITFMQTQVTSWGCLYGIKSVDAVFEMKNYSNSSGTQRLAIANSSSNISVSVNQKHHLHILNGIATLDDVQVKTYNKDYTYSQTNNICLWTSYMTGEKGYFVIYGDTVLYGDNNGTELCRLVCSLNSSNVGCMYDLVADAPRLNAGTGNFIAGEPI